MQEFNCKYWEKNYHINTPVQILHISDTHDWYMSAHKFSSRCEVLFHKLQWVEYLCSNWIHQNYKIKQCNKKTRTNLVFSKWIGPMVHLSKFILSFPMPSLRFLNAVSLTHPGGREWMLNSSIIMICMHVTRNVRSRYLEAFNRIYRHNIISKCQN